MKTYIVFVDGRELPAERWIRATDLNSAERKAKAVHRTGYVSVEYTEVSAAQERRMGAK